MNLLKRFQRMPKRRLTIVLTIFVVILLGFGILLGAILTGKIKFQAAENPQITNTATATFTDSTGNTVTIQSNTVATEVLPSSPTEYGQILEGSGRANFDWWRQYPTQTIKFAASFVASKTGAITEVSIPMRTSTNYGAGTYGPYTFELFTNNPADNFPSTTSLAQVTNVNPPTAMGGSDDAPAFVAMSANLQAGQIYHLVLTNTNSRPDLNYASVNTLMTRVFPWDGGVVLGARAAVYKDGAWHPWMSTDSSNMFRTGNNYDNGSHVALRLKWSDASYTGDSFWSASFSAGAYPTFCGANKGGEYIVWNPSDATINKIGLPLLKTGSPANITYHLEKVGGSELATGTISASQFTSTTTPTWGYADLSTPATLVNGSSYRLWFESPSSTCGSNYYELHPVYGPGSPTSWYEGTWGGLASYLISGTTSWTATKTQDFSFSLQTGSSTGTSANIDITLQGRTNLSGSNIRMTVYQAGTTTKAFEKTDISTNASGDTNVTVTGLTVGTNYDFQLKVPYFLSKKITNQTFTNNMTITFSGLRAGDLNNDGIINSADFTLMNAKWFQADAVADINQDGIVNTADYSWINLNWFATDQ